MVENRDSGIFPLAIIFGIIFTIFFILLFFWADSITQKSNLIFVIVIAIILTIITLYILANPEMLFASLARAFCRPLSFMILLVIIIIIIISFYWGFSTGVVYFSDDMSISPEGCFDKFFNNINERDSWDATNLTIYKFGSPEEYNNSKYRIQMNIDNDNYPDVHFPKVIPNENLSTEQTLLTESNLLIISEQVKEDYNITVIDCFLIRYSYYPYDIDDPLGDRGEVVCIKVKHSWLLSSYHLVPKDYYQNQAWFIQNP